MKRMSSLSIAAPIAVLLLAAAPNLFSDDHDKKTDVTITEPIQVPGAVLQPGTYMFILLNSASDRHIVEVKSVDGSHLYAMTFATAAQRVTRTGKVALTFYEMPQGSPNAIREWFWPGDYEGQAFLYSHQQAAEITAATHQTVPELTNQEAATVAAKMPAATSDSGAPTASLQQSSKQSDESVQQASETTNQQSTQQIADQPVQPQQSVESNQTAEQNPVIAQVAPPADNSSSNVLLAQNSTPAPAPQSAANSTNDSDNASLPKTASDLPLIGLLGLASLGGAMTLRLVRRGRV